MSLTLLLLGDLHARSGPHLQDVRDCLRFAAKLADERQVHGVLLAGDIYEGKSTEEERQEIGAALYQLSVDVFGGQREVIVVKGNHDRPLDLAVFSGYPNVSVMERPGIVPLTHPRSTTTVDVLCCPWPERAFLAASGFAGEQADQAGSTALAAMLRAMVAMREHPERPLVTLAHLQVLGAISSSAQPLIGRSIEVALGDLQDLGAVATVLGHVHKPQQLAPGVEYCGSLSVHDFGEEAEQKRVGLLTIDDAGAASWEWVPVPCRRWVTIEAKVDGGAVLELHPLPAEHPFAEVQVMPPDCAVDDYAGCNVRYRFTCDESEQHLFDEPAIRRRFAAAHTLKIESEITRATASRAGAAEVAAARSVADKLIAYGAAAGVEITTALLEKLHTLEEGTHV